MDILNIMMGDFMIRCHNWWVEYCDKFTCQLVGECFIYIHPDDLEDLGFKEE